MPICDPEYSVVCISVTYEGTTNSYSAWGSLDEGNFTDTANVQLYWSDVGERWFLFSNNDLGTTSVDTGSSNRCDPTGIYDYFTETPAFATVTFGECFPTSTTEPPPPPPPPPSTSSTSSTPPPSTSSTSTTRTPTTSCCPCSCIFILPEPSTTPSFPPPIPILTTRTVPPIFIVTSTPLPINPLTDFILTTPPPTTITTTTTTSTTTTLTTEIILCDSPCNNLGF